MAQSLSITRSVATTLAMMALVALGVGCGDNEAPLNCPTVVFAVPAGTTLGPADDLTMDCSDGFDTNIRLDTSAAAGTEVELTIDSRAALKVAVVGTSATFENVSFDTKQTANLSVKVAGADAACAPVTRTINVDCGGPRCSINRPVGPLLTSADNQSMIGGEFSANFTIDTDIEDGQSVEVIVDGGTPARGTAMGGHAELNRVDFGPDGDHQVFARCTNLAGMTGRSARRTYTVDTAGPSLTIIRPANNTMFPESAADTNPSAPGKQFQVCAKSDAAGGPISAAIVGSIPDVPNGRGTVPGDANTEVCVEVTCPTGPAPFNVIARVTDTANNSTQATIRNLSCASTLPSVRIVDPVASVQGVPSTYLRASRDTQPGTPGLQYTVVACADRSTGMGQLRANGTKVGSTVALTASTGSCASLGFSGEARFVDATIPESMPVLAIPGDPFPDNPRLDVQVTSTSGMGMSPAVLVFVDSKIPVVSVSQPSCGANIPTMSSPTATVDFTIPTDALPVTLVVQKGSDTPITRTATAFTSPGQVVFTGITMAAGDWTVRADATDPAGNVGSSTTPCALTVGQATMLSFTAPVNNQVFGAAGDTDPSMEGFHGATVTLSTSASDGSMAALTVGSAPAIMAPATGGVVTFNNVTLPESDALTLSATITNNAALGDLPGTASIMVVVDTLAPSAPTTLTTMVVGRRAGAIRLGWMSAADPSPGGGPTRAVAGYELRYSNNPIDAGNFAAATPFTYGGTPTAPGLPDHADTSGLRLGIAGTRQYHLAVRAVDRGGNKSPILATTTATALDILTQSIAQGTSMLPQSLGNDLSGGYDLNGDNFPDVVVGSAGGFARIYFGSAGGIDPAVFTEFVDPASGFGTAVISMGDMNGDGIGEVAISASGASINGRVYIYLGRSDTGSNPWPKSPMVALSAANADVTIIPSGDDLSPLASGSQFGISLAKLDFNGDGLGDLAIGAPAATNTVLNPDLTNAGAVVIIAGRSTPLPATLNAPADAAVFIRGTRADNIQGMTTFASRFGNVLAYSGRLVGNDGFDDLLVGTNDAPGNRGSVYVIAGRAFGASTIELASQADAAYTHDGFVAEAVQRNVAMPGDINGDGLLDFAVGSISSQGFVTLYFGNAMGGIDLGPTFNNSPFNSDVFGVGISRLYDGRLLRVALTQNMPSASDLLVSSRRFHNADPPAIMLYRGRTDWTGIVPGSFDEIFRPAMGAASSLTKPVRWVGDINGDGFEDLMVGQTNDGRFIMMY